MRARDIFAGARLATSFLCYRDADARTSQQAIHQWLHAHPARGGGFIGVLADTAHTLPRTTAAGEQALRLTRELTQQHTHSPPEAPPDVDCAHEYVEGYRSAAPLVGHMLRGDNPARNMLIHRIQDSPSLTRGAANGLADITVATARRTHGERATELLHYLHTITTGAQAHAQPLNID